MPRNFSLMPAPECTCQITMGANTSHLRCCPLHEAAGDLYTAVELLLEPNCGPNIYSDLLRAKARAALLKANPQRTQENCPACKMQFDGTDAKCATCGRGVCKP